MPANPPADNTITIGMQTASRNNMKSESHDDECILSSECYRFEPILEYLANHLQYSSTYFLSSSLIRYPAMPCSGPAGACRCAGGPNLSEPPVPSDWPDSQPCSRVQPTKGSAASQCKGGEALP